MPNFRAKELLDLNLPFEKEGVCFLWQASKESTRLVLTQSENTRFFIQISQHEDFFTIKGEKCFKPAQTRLLSHALEIFANTFCKGILNSAFKVLNKQEKMSFIEKDTQKLLAKLKKEPQIYIEIGFGSGRHLLFRAQNEPQVLMLGIEIYAPALNQVNNLARNLGLKNVLLTQSDARSLLSLLESNSVDKIFLHFPVPWLKKPHRRVLGEDFINEALRVLKVGGEFELRTDCKEYFDFGLELFLKEAKLSAKVFKNKDLEITSKYEARWRRQEKDIFDLKVRCEQESAPLKPLPDFSLKDLGFNAQELLNLSQNFKRQSFKFKDFFVHLEELYSLENKLLLKASLGSFDKAQTLFLTLDKSCAFVFNEPLKSTQCLKAFDALKEILKNLSKNELET